MAIQYQVGPYSILQYYGIVRARVRPRVEPPRVRTRVPGRVHVHGRVLEYQYNTGATGARPTKDPLVQHATGMSCMYRIAIHGNARFLASGLLVPPIAIKTSMDLLPASCMVPVPPSTRGGSIIHVVHQVVWSALVTLPRSGLVHRLSMVLQ